MLELAGRRLAETVRVGGRVDFGITLESDGVSQEQSSAEEGRAAGFVGRKRNRILTTGKPQNSDSREKRTTILL